MRSASKVIIFLLAIPIIALYSCSSKSRVEEKVTEKAKKIIATGWEFIKMTPKDLLINKAELDKLPFNGVAIGYNIATDKHGENYSYSDLFGDPFYEKKQFEKDISVGKNFKSEVLTDNFVMVWAASKNRISWSDDKAWERISHNMGVIGWFAKEIGFKGILWDQEDYRRTDQFFYTQSLDGDYETVCTQARKRGKQIMTALTAEYPDITVYTMWFMTHSWGEMNSNDPVSGSKAKGDIWYSFANGLLDGLSSQATIIDGSECGYYLQSEEFFYETDQSRHKALCYVAHENVQKYKNQVMSGTAIYLDMYANNESTVWYYPPLAGSRAGKLRQNLFDALAASDKYVWTWNEESVWANWKYSTQNNNKSMPMLEKLPNWEKSVPGIHRAIKLARDPLETARKIVTDPNKEERQKNKLLQKELLIDNKSLKSSDSIFIKGWLTRNDGSLYAAHVLGINKRFPDGRLNNGFFYQVLDVEYGEWYAIEGLYKDIKNANVNILIGWGPAKSNGMFHFAHEVILAFNQPSEHEWHSAFDVVQVPRGAVRMYFFICIRNLNEDEIVSFNNLGVYKLD